MLSETGQKRKMEKIYYFSSTHWDREWYKPFQGFRVKLVDTLNGIIDTLERNGEFTHFTMDGQTSLLDDYLEIMPQNRDRLKELIKEGKISVGPWYTQPDEYLISGESIIQNLLLGHKKSAEFGAEAMKYGYVPDTFGHIAQLPQILNGIGVKSALIGRGVNDGTFPAFFIWEAPDKSRCTTYKVSEILGYGTFFALLAGYLICDNTPDESEANNNKMTEENALKIACEHIAEELERTSLPFVVLMDGLDHQPIHENGVIIAKRISEYYNCPVVFDSLEELAEDIEKYDDELKVFAGELNRTGKDLRSFTNMLRHTLSSRYDIKKANDKSQNLLEKWMLPISAMARLKGVDIPKSYQDVAYRYMALNHAHDSICGCSIDEVHKDMHYRFRQVTQIGEEITDKAVAAVTNVDIDGAKVGRHILRIFNPLFTGRKETITAEIVFETGYPNKYKEAGLSFYEINAFQIKDMDGNEVPYQINSISNNSFYKVLAGWQNKKGDIYTVTFDAILPSNGYAQYFIEPSETPTRYLEKMEKEHLKAENEFIILSINNDGTFNIQDKKTSKTYRNLNSFLDNSEIGDGWNHYPLVNDVLCYSDRACRRIEKISDGPASITYKITALLEIPDSAIVGLNSCRRSEEYVKLEIASYVTLGRKNKWVDVELVINNIALDHRLKVLFPTGIESDEYYASQAFAFVKRKTGSNLSSGKWKEFDSPENNFEGIVLKRDNEGRGIAFISAYGLHECEAMSDIQGTIAITLFRSFGRTVYTNGQSDGQILGINKFKYRLFPFDGSDTFAGITVIKDLLRAGEKSITTYSDTEKASNDVINQKGFQFKSRNLVISSVKSAEDDDCSLIIRFFNCSDIDAEGELISPYKISSVFETDLLENPQSEQNFKENALIIKAAAWQIKTYRISFIPAC